jgi:hypothetical protein
VIEKSRRHLARAPQLATAGRKAETAMPCRGRPAPR